MGWQVLGCKKETEKGSPGGAQQLYARSEGTYVT